MRLQLMICIGAMFLGFAAMAQEPQVVGVPFTGNRAICFHYQPTPAEVVPAEKQAGIVPSGTRLRAENRELEQIDRDALRSEGLRTDRVPDMNNGAQ
jgi:hypothetical protein